MGVKMDVATDTFSDYDFLTALLWFVIGWSPQELDDCHSQFELILG